MSSSKTWNFTLANRDTSLMFLGLEKENNMWFTFVKIAFLCSVFPFSLKYRNLTMVTKEKAFLEHSGLNYLIC